MPLIGLIGLRPNNRLHPVRHQPTTHPAERQTSMRKSMGTAGHTKVRSAAHGHTVLSRHARSSKAAFLIVACPRATMTWGRQKHFCPPRALRF